MADTSRKYPPYLKSVSVSTAGLQSGDTVKVVFYATNNTTILSEVSTTGGTITAPSNAFYAYIKLTTGNASGIRYAWFNSATNTIDKTAYFDAPDTSNTGTGGDPGGGTDIDPDPGTGNSGGAGGDQIVKYLKKIVNNQDDMLSDFGTVKSRLGSIIGQLDTANSHLSVIENDLGQLKNYVMTPRSSDSIEVNGLYKQIFDPTPPPLNDPPQQPYTYNRQPAQMPPFIDSPGPLPINPNPIPMAHDPAAIRDIPLGRDPVSKDQPRQKDPIIRDNPAIRDPATRDNPLVKEPVKKDAPTQKDPVVKDSPMSRDPVIRDNPIPRDKPIIRDSPLSRDAPIKLDPPIKPTPSI